MILSLAGLGVEQVIVSPGALRTGAGATLALAVFATMALWVRVNRIALEQQEACDCAWEKVTVRVVRSRRPAPLFVPAPLAPEPLAEHEEHAWAVGSGTR